MTPRQITPGQVIMRRKNESLPTPVSRQEWHLRLEVADVFMLDIGPVSVMEDNEFSSRGDNQIRTGVVFFLWSLWGWDVRHGSHLKHRWCWGKFWEKVEDKLASNIWLWNPEFQMSPCSVGFLPKESKGYWPTQNGWLFSLMALIHVF
jgi:hypothetical protein